MKINYVLAVLAGALLTSNVWAAEPKSNSVYLVPSWISNKNPASDFSCSRGQSRYRQHLLYMALEGGRLAKSKSNYYNLATFLGYFADNPVAKDEIVTQVQATIDKDVAAMDALVAKRPYFLFVGDYGSSQWEPRILFKISMPEGPNDWNGEVIPPKNSHR